MHYFLSYISSNIVLFEIFKAHVSFSNEVAMHGLVYSMHIHVYTLVMSLMYQIMLQEMSNHIIV